MSDLQKLTVPQLKEKLKEKGLPVSGNKADLIARLSSGSTGTKRKAEPKESTQTKKVRTISTELICKRKIESEEDDDEGSEEEEESKEADTETDFGEPKVSEFVFYRLWLTTQEAKLSWLPGMWLVGRQYKG